MAAPPENYVSLLQLRERWQKRQQEAEESDPLDARPRQERCGGNDRKRSMDGRTPVSLSGKGREKEEHRAGDITGRSYYWGQNKDGEGRGRRGMAVPVAEGSAREQRCTGRSESEVSSCDATSKDGWKLPREKEIVESSCFAIAVIEDSNGKEVKRGDYRPKSSDQRQRSFKRSDSGPARAKEDDAGGNWPRPFGRSDAGGNWPRPFWRNDAGGKDDCGSPRELAAFAEESGALERPSTSRSDPEARLEAQKSTNPPVDSRAIIRSAIVEDSGGKEAKSEVFHEKRGKSKRESHGKNKKDAGVVGAEKGQGGGNWQLRSLKRNEDADVGEDNETQQDFSRNREAINQEVEPANKYSRTEGKLGEKQKNDISSKEMVFRSDEGEVMRRLRDFSIGSSRRREGRERRLIPRAENSRSWSLVNSGRKNGVSASYMDRGVVWVKKGDILSGNNKDDVAQAH